MFILEGRYMRVVDFQRVKFLQKKFINIMNIGHIIPFKKNLHGKRTIL